MLFADTIVQRILATPGDLVIWLPEAIKPPLPLQRLHALGIRLGGRCRSGGCDQTLATALTIVEEELARREHETQQQNMARVERTQNTMQEEQQRSNFQLAIYTSAASSIIAFLCLLVTVVQGRRQSVRLNGWLSQMEGHLRKIVFHQRFAKSGRMPIHKSRRLRRN